MNLVISYSYFATPGSDSDIVALSYCFMALAFSINFVQISQKPYFSSLLFIIWTIISYFIISKIDPIYFQSIYGVNNPKFAGVYQYIGDTFALVSIAITARISTLKGLPKFSFLSRNAKYTNQLVRLIVVFSILVSSIIILFFNSSRASFFSFIIVSTYMLYCLLVTLRNKKFILLFIIISSLILFSTFADSFNNMMIEYNLLSNRNLSAVETGSDGSLDLRMDFYASGIKDIINNPIFGNYSERTLDSGRGTYIHNFLAAFQDFGFLTFFAYLGLVIFCVKQFLNSWKSVNDYECIFFNSLLIFNVIQILIFRHPLGLYAIFVNFGIALKRLCKSTVNL
ncbi:O-antigen ligase family protein [Anabaena lutea]|uniref:O-antigen ligase family protein n=1 Tax=Anabaena lutea FACHB-196 TaxID=2692881 RepID=A0ABR8FI28_9NOST|nr:O-antigen ligase family protein [Anabaena lutea]MBD2569387.1 O-antigen ligase family protein [Anabaena lutea FACHB-196]